MVGAVKQEQQKVQHVPVSCFATLKDSSFHLLDDCGQQEPATYVVLVALVACSFFGEVLLSTTTTMIYRMYHLRSTSLSFPQQTQDMHLSACGQLLVAGPPLSTYVLLFSLVMAAIRVVTYFEYIYNVCLVVYVHILPATMNSMTYFNNTRRVPTDTRKRASDSFSYRNSGGSHIVVGRKETPLPEVSGSRLTRA